MGVCERDGKRTAGATNTTTAMILCMNKISYREHSFCFLFDYTMKYILSLY